MGSIADIRKVVARVRWRVRVQAALRLGLILGALGLLSFAVIVIGVKARWLETDWTAIAVAIAIALPCLGVALGLARRLDDIRLAAALDATGGLHSRLGSALAYARLETRTPMQDEAMNDALGVLSRASPKLAAPWEWPALVIAGVMAIVAAAITVPVVWAIDMPVGSSEGAMLARLDLSMQLPERTKLEMRKDDVAKLDELAEEIAAIEEVSKDEAIREFLGDLNELLRALKDGTITPEEASSRLAALEKALDEWKEQHLTDADKVASQLKSAAEQKKDAHPELKPLVEAMKEEKLEEAAAELEELADKLDKKELTERDKKKISKDLQDLAKALMTERQKEEERLKKDKDRLKDKAKKEPEKLTEKDKERLKDIERQLEKLAQDEKALSEAMRQLEKLGRDFDQAAEDLLRRLAEEMQAEGGSGNQEGQSGQDGNGPEDQNRREQQGEDGQQGAQGRQGPEGREGQQGQSGQGGQEDLSSEEIRRAAQALRRMGQSGQGRQQMRTAEGRMTDVREMLRRAAEGRLGQSGQSGQAGRQSGQSGQSRQAGQSGQSGQGQAQNAWERFQAGASGQQGGEQSGDPSQAQGGQASESKDGQAGDQGMMVGDGGEGKDGEMMLLGGSGQQGPPGGGQPGRPGRGTHAGSEARVGGEGYGEGHDKNLLGERTTMKVQTKEDFVGGQQDEGESRSSIVYGAAQRGFAGTGYAQVHQDYSNVVEDALEQEHIPAGKRTYVRKYFDLIRPR